MESMNDHIILRSASPSDAPLIADAIMEAVGSEITLDFAGSEDRLVLVKRLFTELASLDDSQYSYRNTIIAADADNKIAGVIIAYDGADLHKLRERFIEKTQEILGYKISSLEMTDETSPDEIYIDTLCVFPAYRRKGLGLRLIKEATSRHASTGKPMGLLVDKDNLRARNLYEKAGFRYVGDRPFAGVMMDHLQNI